MKFPSTLATTDLLLDDRLRIDEACDRFEAAWRAGNAPDLAAFLLEVPEAARGPLLRELLILEIDLRAAEGQAADLDDYRERFPAYSAFIKDALSFRETRDGAPDAGEDAAFVLMAAETTARKHPSVVSPVSRDALRAVGYEILGELGKGGMGVVYKARQTSLNRLVALKLIRTAEFATVAERRRFQNEAEAVALLDHPHIVPIYEVGEYENLHYFSMKLIAGTSLDRALSGYSADVAAAARLVRSVAEAIHHAHQRGILHRDLKPGNILVDEQGEPYVTDFGLAKRVDAPSDLTHTGAIMGTPAFMSPEQAKAGTAALTTATDVYGIGSILYALLTGNAPFSGTTLLDTLDKVRDQAPRPPSRLNSQIPRDLETICLKCLEKAPERRYANAQALADDLGRWLRGEPIVARPVSRAAKTWMWCRRNPVPASLAALLIAAVLGGLAGMTGMWLKADRARIAAQKLNEFLTKNVLAQASTESNPLGADLRMVDVLDRASATLGGSFGDQPEVKAAVRATIGASYYSLGQYAKAEPHLRDAVALDTRLYGSTDPRTLVDMNALTGMLDAAGKTGEAEPLIRGNLATCRRVLGPKRETTLEAAYRLGTLLWHTRRLSEAEALLRECLNGRRSLLREGHPDRMRAMNQLSLLLQDLGRFDEAELLAYQYAESVRCTWGPKHPENVAALTSQGFLELRRGKRSKAESYYRRALEAAQRILGPDHPLTRESATRYARLFPSAASLRR